MPTAWNQIEAAMAYSRGLPLLVLVDEQMRCDGLLEKGNDWYVQQVKVLPESLASIEFTGVLESWRDRLTARAAKVASPAEDLAKPDPAKMSMAQLVMLLKPPQLWAALVAVVGALAGAFALGAKLFG